MKLFALIASIALVLAGCGGSDAADTQTGGSKTTTTGATKTGPTQLPGRPYVPGPSDNLIAFHRTGGVAGVDESLFIRPDGAARVELQGQATRFQLTPEELDVFRQAVDAANFEALKPRYSTGGVVADGFVIALTADGRTVTVEQPAEPPPALGDLMVLANEQIERHR